MLKNKVSDLHMHLNGSYSMSFLYETAIKNNKLSAFIKLKEIKKEYQELATQDSLPNNQKQLVSLIWSQFSAIHNIIQTLTDIHLGTLDVIDSSKAKYMEIRTTPKAINDLPWEKYVDIFLAGLKEGNAKHQDKKVAKGLLSLDRTLHTEDLSYQIIDRVLIEKNQNGLLVGIDICGNPISKRKLTGNTLANVLNYALNKNIGVAIHIGEIDNEIERNEVDVILKTLINWHNEDRTQNSFKGKVRLGHGIFLTPAQRLLIKTNNIPIEICPSCHEKLNWWNNTKPHPVTQIYQFWKDPVVSGTDDEIIFGGDAKTEHQRVLEMLGYPSNTDETEARIHQASFKFS